MYNNKWKYINNNEFTILMIIIGGILFVSPDAKSFVLRQLVASWCPPCRAEFPSIENLYKQFKDNPDIFFLTINEDSDPSVGKAYLEKESFSFPMYQSKGNVPAEVYSGTLPTTVVLDKNGIVRYHHTGIDNYASNKFVKQVEELIKEL